LIRLRSYIGRFGTQSCRTGSGFFDQRVHDAVEPGGCLIGFHNGMAHEHTKPETMLGTWPISSRPASIFHRTGDSLPYHDPVLVQTGAVPYDRHSHGWISGENSRSNPLFRDNHSVHSVGRNYEIFVTTLFSYCCKQTIHGSLCPVVFLPSVPLDLSSIILLLIHIEMRHQT
jgi:hypothetical protein